MSRSVGVVQHVPSSGSRRGGGTRKIKPRASVDLVRFTRDYQKERSSVTVPIEHRTIDSNDVVTRNWGQLSPAHFSTADGICRKERRLRRRLLWEPSASGFACDEEFFPLKRRRAHKVRSCIKPLIIIVFYANCRGPRPASETRGSLARWSRDRPFGRPFERRTSLLINSFTASLTSSHAKRFHFCALRKPDYALSIVLKTFLFSSPPPRARNRAKYQQLLFGGSTLTLMDLIVWAVNSPESAG